MITRLLSTSKDDIQIASTIIRAGGLVAFPTETVYGLGGDAMNPDAARAIYAAKGRPSDNPLIVHIAELSDLKMLAGDIPDCVYLLARQFWPGPLTMVLKKNHRIPDATTGGLQTVAVRMPKSEAALALIRESGTPIAAPSANVSGRPSPTTWEHVRQDMEGLIQAILMGDPCAGGIESTVLDLTGPHPVILRPGLVTPEELSRVLNEAVTYDPAILASPDQGLIPKAPGMKYKHYAPQAEMILFQGTARAVEAAIQERRRKEEQAGRKVGVLLYGKEESRLIARDFFSKLRQMDQTGVDVILAAALPTEDSVGFSVMNRMLKAAGYHVEEV
jgi:L-threonylcarbamoyladenylate synthase